MAPTTFGSYDSAKILVDRLNKLDDRHLTRRVGAFLAQTSTGYARLAEIDDHQWFRRFAIMWRKQRVAMVNFHPDLDTYICAVVGTDYKEWGRGCKA